MVKTPYLWSVEGLYRALIKDPLGITEGVFTIAHVGILNPSLM